MESGVGQTHFARHAFSHCILRGIAALSFPGNPHTVLLDGRVPQRSRGTAGSTPADTTTISWISFSSGAGTCHGVPAPTHAGRLLTSWVRRWLADTYLCGGPLPSLRSNASAPGCLRVKDSGHPLSPGGSTGRVILGNASRCVSADRKKRCIEHRGRHLRGKSRECLPFSVGVSI